MMETLEKMSTSFLVKYVGSFPVIGDGQEGRISCVRHKLEGMRNALYNSKPVLLEACGSEIRILSIDGRTAHMVHALKRISYATCDPDWCQFAFSARQPSLGSGAVDGSKVPPTSHPYPGVQYCHVFLTDSPHQAKEINNYVSYLFREAERRPTDDNQFTVYYEFGKNFQTKSLSSATSSTRDEEKDVSALTSLSKLIGNGVVETNSEKEGDNDFDDELELERRRIEKRSSDLRPIIDQGDDQGRRVSTTQCAKELNSIDKVEMDAGVVLANEGHANGFSSSRIEKPPSKTSTATIDDESPPDDFRRSRHRGVDLPQPRSATIRCVAPEMAAISRALENGSDSPLRPESKRQKRRPLSAVLTNFAGAGKRRTTIIEEKPTDSRRTSFLDHVPPEASKNESNNKNGSILKRLLHLKIGNGSSLRLNLLSDHSSSSSTTIENANGISNGRQRSSQSVRFLGASLDQHQDEVAYPTNGAVLSVASKRRRRPLSAVFGNASSAGHLTNGQGPISYPLTAPNGNGYHFSNGLSSTPMETPSGSKKLGSAKSAVSKMFGFSSSRRKSRSSAQLDTASRRQITLSTDLDITDSIDDGHETTSFRKLSHHNHQPLMDDSRNWDQPPTPSCSDDAPPTNGSSPLLGSGVGCGEHCSISMPNLRYGLDQSLPLTMEEEMKLNGAAWFYGTVSRQLAAQVLENEPEGAFVVRRSVSQPMSSLVLSVRVPFSHNPSGVSHYLILHTAKGFKLKGFTKDFPSVHALVTHHSFMVEQLPCRLVFTDRDGGGDARFNRSSSCSMSNVVLNDHHYQMHQHQKRSQSRHSSPFVNKRHDLVPVTEEESIYGKLPSSPPPPPPEQASSTLFAALKIADAKVY